MAATKKKTTAKSEPTKYQVGESVTELQVDWTYSGPHRLLTVAAIGKRDMTLSDGSVRRINDDTYRATEPTDAARIETHRFRNAMSRLDSSALDLEAVMAMGPAFNAFRGREKRRRLRALAMVRVALIDGPKGYYDLARIIDKGFKCSESTSYIRETGAVETPTSKHHSREYQRTSTREDRIDAVVLRMAGESPNGVDFNKVLAAVDGEMGWLDGVELRKEVIDSAERCGRVPSGVHPGTIQLQAFETRE